MEKFYKSIELNSEESDIYLKQKWKYVYRFDTIAKDLKSFFKKFKPNKNGIATIKGVGQLKEILPKDTGFHEVDLEHILFLLDLKNQGFFKLDELVSQYVFFKKLKDVCQLRKEERELLDFFVDNNQEL
jgi:hypothetical protein